MQQLHMEPSRKEQFPHPHDGPPNFYFLFSQVWPSIPEEESQQPLIALQGL